MNPQRPKILVVDDTPANLMMLANALDKEFSFQLVTSGQAALDMAAKAAPELILLDVMMPGELDGLQVCARVRALPALKDTRVVLLTARGQTQDRDAGQQAGADEYLIKPFSPLQLIETIERLMPAE